MIIYPALDLRGGKVVRLRQGDPTQQKTYGDDPILIAQRWIAGGAQWLHVVNLDGAFNQANDNEQILGRLAQLNIPIQFGGGIRSLEDAARALELGVKRVILGTSAIQRPELAAQAVETFGAEAVSVALDSKNGEVVTHGWQQGAGITSVEAGKRFAALGIRHALFTDISRDGEMRGANLEATIALARETGLQVIASGGVSSLAEITQLRQSGVVAGAILGTALYEGKIDLSQAIHIAE
ncbi:MAG: 1-(5-phosphoribosyl)-5-[(5-phosphoribosylamino) methylideneamino]imidazole-4-carboxamide isomerase [Anaerolineae bacterium]